MLVVKYCKDGELVSDFYAKRFVDEYLIIHDIEICSNMIHYLSIANEMVLNYFINIALSDDPISNKILFQFEEIPWKFDKETGLDYHNPAIKNHFKISNKIKIKSLYDHYLKHI